MPDKSNLLPLKEQLHQFRADLQYRVDNGIHSRGTPTSFEQLDKIISGVQAPDLIVLAARPAMGKTAFATQFLLNFLKKGLPATIFSIEMDFRQLLSRLVAQGTGIPLTAINEARASPADLDKIDGFLDWLGQQSLSLDDTSGPSLDYVEERLKTQDKQGIVIVDYLGILDLGGEGELSREQQVSGATKRIKSMARDYECPIVLLSQLNRECEKRRDKRPLLADLRDSGQVEADADMVWMLYRDYVYNAGSDPSVIEILVRKNRHGSTGVAHLEWQGESTSVI